jgi:hypothetical protein
MQVMEVQLFDWRLMPIDSMLPMNTIEHSLHDHLHVYPFDPIDMSMNESSWIIQMTMTSVYHF